MTVLDLSNNDLSTINGPDFAAAGVTGIIPSVFDRANPPQNMLSAALGCRGAGIDILGWYGFVYFGSPYGVTRDTKWAIQNALATNVKRVWLDAETDGITNGFTDGVAPSVAQRIAELQQCVDLVLAAGLEPGIYTGRWFWVPQMGNSKAFSHLPLWHSEYPADGHEIRTVDYGGWSTVAIHQYTSTLPLCGRATRDANYVFEEDDMADPRVDQLVALVAGNGYRRADGTIAEKQEAFDLAVADGSSLFLGLGNTQGALDLLRRSVMGEQLTDAEKAMVLTLINQVLAGARVTITPGAA